MHKHQIQPEMGRRGLVQRRGLGRDGVGRSGPRAWGGESEDVTKGEAGSGRRKAGSVDAAAAIREEAHRVLGCKGFCWPVAQ
jgi:hypothetical protein